MKHLIVLSAPSGAGKTTVARHLLEKFPQLAFSVSATTRAKRPNEVHGRDYFFLTSEEFRNRLANGDLIEYEEIFGNYYGTLKSVVQNALSRGQFLIFDVDVKGALSLQKSFPEETLLLFVAPPDMQTLEQRLRSRKTETDEQIHLRLTRAEMEMGHMESFDKQLINTDLAETLSKAEEIAAPYITGSPLQSKMF
ncbi:MAG: guanylate kinase [Ignavibacteria bacterium]|nr:guanylate kinase [Ignavibacteria bacterium]